MICKSCNLPMVNAGIPGHDFFFCVRGCQDLTKVLPVVDINKIEETNRCIDSEA